MTQNVSEVLVLKFGIPCNTTLKHLKILIIIKKTIKNWNGVECKCLVRQKPT